MAQNMKDIKRRIGSVGSIMQITNAMELVSSAKFRKARQRLEATRPYYKTVCDNINELIGLSKDNTSKLLKSREVKTRAVLVVASNRGLAGGYNINVVKEAVAHTRDGVETIFYSTGLRAVELLKKYSDRVNKDFTMVSEQPTMEEAQAVGAHLLELYQKEKIDELLVVYTRFNSALSLEPHTIKVLPAEGFDKNKEEKKTDILFEPSASMVLHQMLKQFVNISIYGALLEASASEQASRRTAMENATSNGEELLSDLELVYNRARQAQITQEISEIVGGAEALK